MVRLSTYTYTCVHVPGSDKVWADLLSRWVAPPTLQPIVTVTTLPSSSDNEFVFVPAAEVKSAHMAQSDHGPSNVRYNADRFYYTSTGALWVPDVGADLQLQPCIIAHSDPSGHRFSATTADLLRRHYSWSTLGTDIGTFEHFCIYWFSTVGGEKILRPYGPVVHGISPNVLLQFYYI